MRTSIVRRSRLLIKGGTISRYRTARRTMAFVSGSETIVADRRIDGSAAPFFTKGSGLMTTEETESIEVDVELVGAPNFEQGVQESVLVPASVVETISTEEIDVFPAPEPISVVRQAVDRLAETIGKRLDSFQSTLDREMRAEAAREKIVDRLHSELQEYKNDFLTNLMRPIFIDLIQLHDDIGKMVESQNPREAGSMSVVDPLQSVRQGIEDILYRQGVEPFEVEDAGFDPRRQRAVTTQPTEDPERNRCVAARLRKGFRLGEKIVRPEIVSVYAFKR